MTLHAPFSRRLIWQEHTALSAFYLDEATPELQLIFKLLTSFEVYTRSGHTK